MKRPLAHGEAVVPDAVHPSRKRRVGYSEVDTQLASAYNDLADEAPAVRLRAAGVLLKTLSSHVPDRAERVHAALTRLIRGLCSGRKAARLGFSIALCELLRLAFRLARDHNAGELRLGALIALAIRATQSEGKASGQEIREHLLGRRFALQAILQSDVAHDPNVTDEEWRSFCDALTELARHKDWLWAECGAMLYDYLDGPEGKRLSEQRVRILIDALQQAHLLRTPEGVAIWLCLADNFAEVLPPAVWHKKDPFASKERSALKKVLQANSNDSDGPKAGTRQSQPSFAWRVVLSHAVRRKGGGDFEQFWIEAVDSSFFGGSSSTERKALGLQVVSLAVATTPISMLRHVLGRNTLRTIINQRAETGRYLYEAAKLPLDQCIARVKKEPVAANELLGALLGEGALDQSTKTKTIEAILAHADNEALPKVVQILHDRIISPSAENDSQAESRRRTFADMLLAIVRAHRDPSQLVAEDTQEGKGRTSLAPWLTNLLQALVELGYCSSEGTPSPVMAEASRAVIRARLMSCLGLLMDRIDIVMEASAFVVARLKAAQKTFYNPLSGEAQEILKTAQQSQKQIASQVDGSALQAYRLLLNLSTLQVYNTEPDSVEALQDLITSLEARREGGESQTMLVELLLSFISKPSALFRKLAEQVFSTFASELTSDSLQSLLDILQQKESLSGQQALFDQDGERGADSEDDAGDDNDGADSDGMDVEDASDVELVNGEHLDESEAEGSDGSESDSDSGGDSQGDGEDEEAAFDRKLAAALGTTGVDEDEDEDGSDMDDEQMMALEPHLVNIFAERKKSSSKKQDNKEAKENIINFKNRVLDLLSIYVKSQYANVVALELILPLVTLVRTTTSKPTAEKAFAVVKQYFEACNKNKSLPHPNDHGTCFDIMSAVHAEMKVGGSKLQANICSRASLYLARVLVAVDQGHYERVTHMYGELQSQWYLDPKCKRVAITGDGSGTGTGLTRAFADAGAFSIAILGRRIEVLQQTQQEVTAGVTGVSFSTRAVNVIDSQALKIIAQEIEEWDILVSNAGYLPTTATVPESDADDWWPTFEIDVKGSFNLAQAFLPSRSPTATILSVNAGSIQVSGAFSAKYSAYNSSKFAVLRLFEILAVEIPDVHVVSMHPGIIDTDMFHKGGMATPPTDTLELPSHSAVWLCSSDAKFLRGRFVWTNWDVDQLKAKKAEIEGGLSLTANCIGWPFEG